MKLMSLLAMQAEATTTKAGSSSRGRRRGKSRGGGRGGRRGRTSSSVNDAVLNKASAAVAAAAPGAKYHERANAMRHTHTLTLAHTH